MQTRDPEKIAIIGTHAYVAIRFRGSFIARLAKKGHTVYVLADDYTEATRIQIKTLGAIPLDSPLNRSNLNPIEDIWATFRLAKHLKTLELNRTLAYCVKPIIFGTFAAALAGVHNRFALFEGLGYPFTKRPKRSLKAYLLKRIQLFLYYFAFPRMNGAIFLNQDDHSELCHKYGLTPNKTMILKGIGVPERFFQFTPPPSAPLTFLFIGRLVADKGIREFVEAAQITRKCYPEACFQIIGTLDPQCPSALSEKTYNDLRYNRRGIDWLGSVADVIPHLKAASVLVLPSYREGYPRVIQEAMALGRPVITTQTPGCREAVQNGKDGFLAPPFSATAISQKMIHCLSESGLLVRMGQQAHERAKNCYPESLINQKIEAFLFASNSSNTN